MQHPTLIFTAHKQSLQGLCFHRCLSVHGGSLSDMAGGMHGRGHVWQGVCVAGGGHACQGYAWWGACMAGETATGAGDMHPNGMLF